MVYIKNIKKITAITCCAMLICTGVFVYARLATNEQVIKNLSVQKKLVRNSLANAIDTANLNLLRKVYAQMDPGRKEFLIKGTINARNGADTTQILNNAEYLFSRKGNLYYYKIGQLESINLKGVNIFIDHGIKKILISRQKTVLPGTTIPDVNLIIKQITEEGFKLVSNKNKDIESISLVNPSHISCKEYSFTFDAKTKVPRRVFMRLTNFEQPYNNKMDNTFDLKIARLSTNAEIEKYVVLKGVVRKNNAFVRSVECANYELINIL